MKTTKKAHLWHIPPMSLPKRKFAINAPAFKKEGIEFEVAFLEGVLEDDPDNVECLRFLALAHTLSGSHERALGLDTRLSQLRPRDPEVFYNLGCSRANTGDVDGAFQALGRAVELGYRDVRHLEQDRDLDSIRGDRRYKVLIQKLKE
ncbi:MAG: hypothetical protein FJ272_08815 [Planctomycetes bacterium]|nr:hypothetical protein [Planctomycetota bacterium]